jgi:hypothetical protein
MLDLAIRTLFDAIVIRPDKADGHFPHDMATPDFLFKRRSGTLTQQAQFVFRHGAFHPEQ